MSSNIQWKGKTFNQITSAITKNENTITMEGSLLFKAGPIKGYRREIVTKTNDPSNPRISSSVNLFDIPNGYLVVPSDDPCECNGIQNTLDINYTNNKTENGTCNSLTTNGLCFDPASNAKRRARSSGIIKKNIGTAANPDIYSTNTNQYLSSRAKTFKQNEFNYLRSGNASVKPGAPGAENNKYAANQEGIKYVCNGDNNYVTVNYKPSNYKFANQGGVSSSDRMLRLKYNTITDTGASYTAPLGNQVANALSYGKSADAYTIKDKMGVQRPCVPTFSKHSSEHKECDGKTPYI